jgi:hypothetical protein
LGFRKRQLGGGKFFVPVEALMVKEGGEAEGDRKSSSGRS